MMGFVHILRIAIAIALITHLAPTTRAAHNNAENSDIIRHHQLHRRHPPHSPPQYNRPPDNIGTSSYAIPQAQIPQTSTGKQGIWNSIKAIGNLKPDIQKLKAKNEKKYNAMPVDPDFFQEKFTELTDSLPKTVEEVEERGKSDLVKLSVEVIVLGRLLATEQEKRDSLDEEQFGKTMWSLVRFLEMMTPSVPARGKGKEPEKGALVPYLDLSLSFFDEKIALAFQKRERNYHDAHYLDDQEKAAHELDIRRGMMLITRQTVPYSFSRPITWTWDDVDGLQMFFCILRLWADSRGPAQDGRHGKYVKQELDNLMALMRKTYSSLPDGRPRFVKEYLKQKIMWFETYDGPLPRYKIDPPPPGYNAT
ncbi:hypothetical protein H0H93_009060 [Arthromyces matolae]|nr:hypothetical protein H0H93_009060 [Arthromyces matolae]